MKNTEKKSILIVARQPVGGIKTYFNYVYKMNFFSNYKFDVVTPSVGISDYLGSVFKGKDFTYHESLNSNKSLIISVLKLLRNNSFDLIHTHGFTSGLLLSPIAKLFKIPHVMTAHDVLLDWQFKGWRGELKKILIGICFRLIDVVMAVGDDARNNLAEVYPWLLNKEGKLISIRNGIDVDRFYLSGMRDIKKELDLPSDTILFGFFGRFMSQKGFGYLVDSLEKLIIERPKCKVVVVAFGWGGFIREEQENLRKRSLLHFFYFIPHTDDMPAAIRGVDAVVMPSLWEACPLLPMEAMTCGIPVLASDCIGLKEVTQNTPSIQFTAKDSSSLKCALIQFIDDRKKIQESAQTFASQAKEKFDVCKSANELNKLYKNILGLDQEDNNS